MKHKTSEYRGHVWLLYHVDFIEGHYETGDVLQIFYDEKLARQCAEAEVDSWGFDSWRWDRNEIRVHNDGQELDEYFTLVKKKVRVRKK